MRTKFFTGEGDSGESKIGEKKVPKSSVLVELLGELDELNSWLGFCRVAAERDLRDAKLQIHPNDAKETEIIDVAQVLEGIQNSLFIIQAEVAALGFGYPKSPEIGEDKTYELEDVIRKIDEVVPKIEKFVIPGGTELSARLDVARAITRRVERLAKKYGEKKQLREPLLKYLNRLSSVLFALARHVNYKIGAEEKHPSYK